MAERQRPAGCGLGVGPQGCFPAANEDLFEPLSWRALSAFGEAAERELRGCSRRLVKRRASHSPAALVFNFFERWLRNDQGSQAFGIRRVELEAKLPPGLLRMPPAPGLLLAGKRGRAVELAEPLRRAGERFNGAYFEGRPWSVQGMSRCGQLAERLRRGETGFSCPGAFQLPKHAFGVKRNRPRGRPILLDIGERASLDQAREADGLAAAEGDALGFRGVSHRENFERLGTAQGARRDHVKYMQARYCPKRGP